MHVQSITTRPVTTPGAATESTPVATPGSIAADIAAIRVEAANAAAFAATGSCPWAGGKPPKGGN